MNPDNERDELWELLGRARKPVPNPFFARNILRRIRLEQKPARSLWSWVARPWRIAALGSVAAAVLAAFLLTQHPTQDRTPVQTVEIARTTPDSADYEVIARLDELLAFENNAIWLVTSPE